MAVTAAPRDQPLALALWGTFVPAGIAAAQALAGGFAERLGWRGLFWADAVLLALMLAVAYFTVSSRRAAAPGARAAILRDVTVLRLALAFFCFALTFLALAGLLPAYLVEARGLLPAEAGQIAALGTAGGILGSLFAGWRMRYGASPGRFTAIGLIASSAATLLIFPAVVPTPLAGIGAAAAFVIGGLVPAAVFALVPRLAPNPAAIGPVNGLIAQLGSLGSLLGPPLLAVWVTGFGWDSAPLLLLGVAAAGVLCLRGMAPR